MTTLAAIDVGSNAMRLAIGETRGAGMVDVLQTAREPVRLGRDVFSQGRLSPEIMDHALEAFHRFAGSMRDQGVEHAAAIATSAMREAENGKDLADRILDEDGDRRKRDQRYGRGPPGPPGRVEEAGHRDW